MAAVITASVNGDFSSPGIDLSVSGLVAGTYTIVRHDVDGILPDAPVRGADAVTVIGASAIAHDLEAPYNGTYYYSVQNNALPVVNSNTESLVLDYGTGPEYYQEPLDSAAWIKDVSDSTKNQTVIVENFEGNDYQAAILSESRVLGRPNPVVFTDVFGNRTGQFSILQVPSLMGVPSTHAQMRDLLTSGDVLLFQNKFDHTGQGYRDMFFIVTSLSESFMDKPRFDVALQGYVPDVVFSIGYTEVDRPPTTGETVGAGTWQAVKDDPTFTTYAAVAARDLTYQNTLYYYSV